MVPNSRKVKVLQWLITAFLLAVLVAIAAIYVYYGMNFAANPVAEMPVAPVMVTVEPTEMERRMVILEELAKQSTNTLTSTEREEILEELVKSSDGQELSEEERRRILEAM